MKTIRFDCNGHNAPAYSCNKPYDNSGEYVTAEVAQGLYEALVKAKGALPGHNWGAILDIDDALAAADGENT